MLTPPQQRTPEIWPARTSKNNELRRTREYHKRTSATFKPTIATSMGKFTILGRPRCRPTWRAIQVHSSTTISSTTSSKNPSCTTRVLKRPGNLLQASMPKATIFLQRRHSYGQHVQVERRFRF